MSEYDHAKGGAPPPTADDLRAAPRTAVDLPMEADATGHPVSGRVLDVSATGLRMRLSAKVIGFEPTLDLSELARAISGAIGQRFRIWIDPASFGRRLEREIRLTRLSLIEGDLMRFELGACFVPPLGPEETELLGIAPAVQAPEPSESDESSDSAAAPDADVPALGHGVGKRFRAFVRCSAAGAPPATACHTELVALGGVRVRMPRSHAGIGASADDVLRASAQLTERFGDEVTLKLADGPTHLWTGPARITAVELPPERADVLLVSLHFSRALRPPEVRRLGLTSLLA